ncbi:MAG: hypothetical protein HGB33_04485 [Syntrophaceae bacterium]|nr:hypothetical protein [Syntrophaceae bacterium]
MAYSTKTNDAEERLFRVIELLLPGKKLKFYRSIDDLCDRLRQPVFNPRIIILLAASRKELEDILSIRELLEDAKIILIVPDTDPATLARGHTLRPRFLSDRSSDFVDVAAVLGQMIRKMGHNRQHD